MHVVDVVCTLVYDAVVILVRRHLNASLGRRRNAHTDSEEVLYDAVVMLVLDAVVMLARVVWSLNFSLPHCCNTRLDSGEVGEVRISLYAVVVPVADVVLTLVCSPIVRLAQTEDCVMMS
ncbi:hypothetical protein FRC08_001760 [Ceratobasidium sp. 394]|nr:hypothetical protein FRC08_001760 [Ceratobasidium sp. 394]